MDLTNLGFGPLDHKPRLELVIKGSGRWDLRTGPWRRPEGTDWGPRSVPIGVKKVADRPPKSVPIGVKKVADRPPKSVPIGVKKCPV